tara:strand:+ start:3636 stop:4907 length:1272 start_codon:yes stop_codon:yes gene_type:complete
MIYKIKSKSIKDVFSMVSAQVLLRPFQIAKSFLVAKYLGPEIYGILKSTELIKMLNKFGSLGFKPTIIRNVTTARAQGNKNEEIDIKNNAYTAELILSIIIVLISLVSSFFFTNYLIKISIILSSLGLFLSKIFGLFETELRLNKEFTYLSRFILLQGILNSVFISLTVPFFNFYSVLCIPIATSIFIIFRIFRITNKFFVFKLNWLKLKDIFKVSIPLTFGTLSYGFFKYSERIIIITFLGLKATGIFGFAETIVTIFSSLLIGSVMKVRGIKILEELGKRNYSKVNNIVFKETSILILISLLFIGLIVILLKYFIPIFLPDWTIAINATILYSFCIPIKLLSSYIAFVIKSPTIGKLKFEPLMYLFITLLMLIGLLILKYYKYLSLINFIIVILFCLLFMHLCYVALYMQSFYFKFVYKND